MPKGRSGKSGRRKGGSVPASARAFEAQLARGGDSFPLRGKFLTSASNLGTTPSAFFNLQPSSLGVRAVALAAVFARYRFKYVRIKFQSNILTATFPSILGNVAIGVLDDATTAEGNAPTTANSVVEMRCSGTNMGTQTVPTEIVWVPLDRTKWFSTYPGVAGSDARLTSSGVLYAGSTVASGGGTVASVDVEIDYSLVFAGAVDIGAT